jgi:hypothetical protein
LSPGLQLIEILNTLQRNDEHIVSMLRRNQIDINEFNDDPASGIVSVQSPIRSPVLITDIIATWVAANVTGSSLTAVGSAVTPTAGTVIATLTPGVIGDWLIEWTVEIDTAAATVPDNFALNSPAGTKVATSENPVATGIYVQQNAVVNITSLTQVVNVTAIATDATGTYKATIIATPQFDLEGELGTAILTFGGRTLQLPYQDGTWQALGMHGMQLDNTGSKGIKLTLTVTPACAVHLEICGSADYRKMESP